MGANPGIWRKKNLFFPNSQNSNKGGGERKISTNFSKKGNWGGDVILWIIFFYYPQTPGGRGWIRRQFLVNLHRLCCYSTNFGEGGWMSRPFHLDPRLVVIIKFPKQCMALGGRGLAFTKKSLGWDLNGIWDIWALHVVPWP